MNVPSNSELRPEELLAELLRERFQLPARASAYFRPVPDPAETEIAKARRRHILNEALPDERFGERRAS